MKQILVSEAALDSIRAMGVTNAARIAELEDALKYIYRLRQMPYLLYAPNLIFDAIVKKIAEAGVIPDLQPAPESENKA